MPRKPATEPMRLAPQIVVQADLGGYQIALTEVVPDASADEVDARLDAYRKAIDRQRAHGALVEALVDLRAREERLAALPAAETEMVKQRGIDRARMREGFEQTHIARRPRADFQLNDAQRKALEAFDAQTAAERAKLEAERKGLEHDIPIVQKQVERQRAIIAGADRAESIDVVPTKPRRSPVPEAAD